MSLVALIEWMDVTSVSYSILSTLFPLSSHVWSITSSFMTWYFFTCIVVLFYFIIDTSNWLCMSFFFQGNEFFKWNFGMKVDTRKFWISYSIITVWCILNISSLLFKCELTAIHILFLDLNETFPPCFLLDDLNTMTIYFTSVKQCHNPIKIKHEF